MSYVNDFEVSPEFGGKSEEELLDEFMNECSVTDDAYICIYGEYYKVMRELSSAAKDVFMWIAFNCEVDKGRIALQSFAQQQLLKELGITTVTYYRCLSDLKSKDLIRGTNARYYVNPRVMWKGSSGRRSKFMCRYPYISNEK